METASAVRNGEVLLTASKDGPCPPIDAPGRPDKPKLVLPRDTPQRGLGSVDGRAAFLHAIAHIEFNAINLAWDAVLRFRAMPEQFYLDWVSVAEDEARHFSLLSARLHELGHSYGDFDAHNGLWEMAEKTADSCLARMALVPRVLEARGLDVSPGMIARLRGLGDIASAEILELILREEVRHVAIGSRWFAWCCEREGRDPESTFIDLVRGLVKGAVRGPFNRPARRLAGFADSEMDKLSALEHER
jgi:uncharacterized ferritin-like protein (DUF455 family)